MATYSVYKETALPGTLVANAIYLVAPAANPGYLEIYVTDVAGTAQRRTPRIEDIQAMIDATVGSAAGTVIIVDNIIARDALTPENGTEVLVIDASADATVTSGAATYVYRSSNTTWIKTTEFESLDVALTWGSITDGPTSTPAQVDAAVTAVHSHTNKTQLDKVGEDGNGDFTYNGALPVTAWSTTNW